MSTQQSVQQLVAAAKSGIRNLTTAEVADRLAAGGRSALATRALQDLGYTDIAHLDGGLKAWTAEGRPVAPPA